MNTISKENFVPEVYDKFYNEIYKFIYVRVYLNKAITQDLTQEVFLKIWEKRAHFLPEKAALRTWIYQITRNHLIDYYRRRKMPIYIDEEKMADVGGLDTVEDEIILNAVLGKLKLLSEYEQTIIQLRYLQGLSIKEVALIVTREENAVKVALHRTIKKLVILVNERR